MRVEVGPVGDLRPGDRAVVEAAGRRILVLNDNGRLVAIDDACAHKGQSLAEGVVRDGVITCPSHLWRFDLASGHRSDSPGDAQELFPVSADGEVVVVEIPERGPEPSIGDLLRTHAQEWRRDP